MSAAHASEADRLPGRMLALRVIRFAIVGLSATALYAVCAFVFLALGLLSPAWSSLLAYAIAATVSYAGHKLYTFMSAGAHRIEGPRFAVLTLLGLAVSYAMPKLVSGALGLPPQVSVVLVCVLVPVVNFVVMGRWVFAHQGENEAGRRARLSTVLPVAACAAVLAGSLADNSLFNYLHMDISWLLIVAQKMLAGQTLYVDVWETNPPFSIFLYFPWVYLASATGSSAEFLVACAAYLWTAVCIGLAGAIGLRAGLFDRHTGLWLLPPALFFTLVALPATFAQREFFGAVAVLPLLAVAAARLDSAAARRLPAALLVLAGLFGSVIVMVKPHYVPGLAVPYLYLALHRRSAGVLFGPEVWAAVTAFATYVAVVAVFYPEYFSNLLPVLMDVYIARTRPLLEVMASLGIYGLVLAAFYAYVAAGSPPPRRHLPLALAAAGFFVSYLTLGKGWDYHALPFVVTGGMALSMAVIERTRLGTGPLKVTPVAIALVAAFVAFAGAMIYNTFTRVEIDADLAARLRIDAQTPTVVVIGADIAVGHPFTRAADGTWLARECSDWMGAYALEKLKDDATMLEPEERGRLAGYVAEAMTAKRRLIVDGRPDIIAVDRRSSFWTAHVLADPAIAAAVEDYVPAGGKAGIVYLKRKDFDIIGPSPASSPGASSG